MTPNDSEIELLIRRQATRSRESAAADHLDADALNAFAEGALPPAARSKYVSHLADCADCRKLASQLSIHAGAMSAAQLAQVSAAARAPWWKSLSSLIAVPVLRYGAFAVVLVAVVGITFLVWRRSNTARTDLVAQNERAATPVSAVKTDSDNNASQNAQSEQTTQNDQSRIAKAVPQPTAMPQGQEKINQRQADASAPPPAKPETVRTMTESEPSLAARSAASARPEETPSFAPQPVGEANEAKSREQQNTGGITHGGPRRNETYKVLDRNRSADVAKEEDRVADARKVDEDRKDKNQPKQPERGTLSMSAGANRDERSEARKPENKTATSEAPSTRSAGGRKFQRQGNAWVDVKFKSSMAVRNVARGSDEFAALDSHLRSIAQQLSGEVIVVWKGKAYRIQ